jgi:hypothetical protein
MELTINEIMDLLKNRAQKLYDQVDLLNKESVNPLFIKGLFAHERIDLIKEYDNKMDQAHKSRRSAEKIMEACEILSYCALDGVEPISLIKYS